MKLLLLAALVATGTCWSWSTSKESSDPQNSKYTSGNEYVYQYESQVLTGIPQISKQYGGMKIQAKAKIDFTSNSNAVLQLDDVRVLYLNNEIHNPDVLPPTGQISHDKFSSLPSDEAKLIVDKLQQPIKFSYTNGKVQSIEVCKEETNWSVDQKRSILNMLQVSLQATDFTVTQQLGYNNLQKENSTTFDWLEQGLDGECYSSVQVSQSTQNSTQFKVIKSRDETRCLSVNGFRKDVQPHVQRNCECADNMNKKECECRAEQVEQRDQEETQIRTVYDLISSDRQQFLIQKAVQTVQYKHLTPNSPNQYKLTSSNQTLSLIEEKQQEQTISYSSRSFQSINQPWSHQILSWEQENQMMTDSQLQQTVRDALDEIVTISADPSRYGDHMYVFQQLVSKLSQCNKAQLSSVFNEAKGGDNTSQNKKWKALIDGMSYANTTTADKFILEKIVADEIKNQEASSIFAIWASNKIPTQSILEYMRSSVLPTLQGQNSRQITYRHAMLSFGSMVRRYINQEQRNKHDAVTDSQKAQHQSNIDSCRNHEKYVESRLSAASTEQEKILCLKTISNMGNIKSISQVQKLLERTESTTVRVQAIRAFRHFGQQNQLQTVQSMLPLMNHRQEDSEIRINAFQQVMKCDPSSSLLEIQKQLNNETNTEYKTYVVRFLQNYLHRKEPGQEQRNSKIRVILRNIRAFQPSEQTTDSEIPFALNGDELNGDIIRVSFLSNQTSRFSRAASFRQLSMSNGVRRDIVEVGYRAEGMEEVIAKFTEKTSAAKHPDLRQLDSLSYQKQQQSVKPSVTFYARVMGQEISFIHLDQSTIFDLIRNGLQSNSDGNVEIPIQFFQTIMMTPYQLRKLQPHGMWQVDETVYSGVVDIDGTLKVRMVRGEMPTFRFETTKPIRKEFNTFRIQYIDAGFSITGLSSSMTVRRTFNSANMSVTYSPDQNQFVLNHTHPLQSNDLASQHLESNSGTFFMPQRLPKLVRSMQICSRQLKTDDSERKHFTQQLESLKSVEIEAKMECDVNMPEAFSFVKDRLHLIPTQPSNSRQVIKITLRPASSGQRNFTFSYGGQYVNASQLEHMEGEVSQQLQQAKQTLFNFLWSSEDKQGAEQVQVSTKKYLESQSLGSLYHFQHFSVASESSNQVLNMTGNLTKYYEHDFPTTRSLLRFERPPVGSSNEKEPIVFVNKMRSVSNPGSNEFIWSNNMTWGERSHFNKARFTWTMRSTPNYKDNECWSETAYGCKDQYGEVYPTWYNATHQFTYQNTSNVAEQFLNFTKPYLMKSAQSIYSVPNFNWNNQQGNFSVNQTLRPDSYKMDVSFPVVSYQPQSQVCINTNASNIYSPVEVKFWQSLTWNQYPVSQNKPIHDFLPSHNRINPFQSRRDMCVIQAPNSYSFDRKQIAMAKTDCEVILAGDCGSSNKEVLVTIKPASNQDRTAERELKTVVGSNKIQISFRPRSSFSAQQMKVKVNDVQQSLDSNQQVVVEESGRQTAVVQCDSVRCEIYSEKYGVYVSIDNERVQVEVNSEKSHQMCGLCAFTPQRSQQLTMTDSMNLFKENKVPNQQCTVQEPSWQEQQQQDTCSQVYKHKVKYVTDEQGRVQTCVSVDRLPTCTTRCASKSIRTESEQFRCVHEQQAKQLELIPTIEGEELILTDERALLKMKSARVVRSNINSALQCRN